MTEISSTPASDTPSLAPASPGHAVGKRAAGTWAAWWREPLVHFVVLGGLLFAVDHAMVARAGDPRSIVVGAEVDRQARDVFKASRGREPDARELAALRKVWLDNEVLYREGLAMQVDRGDSAIRERVIFKALSIVDAHVQLPPANDATLRAWFERHRAKYDEPARFDFEEALPAGDASEAAVRGLVGALNAHAGGDAEANLRVFKGRPASNLVQSDGPEFAAALQASAGSSAWHVVPSRDGLRAIHLVAYVPAKPAVFDDLRGIVRTDWATALASEQRSAAVHALARKYNVVFQPGGTEPLPPGAGDEDDEGAGPGAAPAVGRPQAGASGTAPQ